MPEEFFAASQNDPLVTVILVITMLVAVFGVPILMISAQNMAADILKGLRPNDKK